MAPSVSTTSDSQSHPSEKAEVTPELRMQRLHNCWPMFQDDDPNIQGYSALLVVARTIYSYLPDALWPPYGNESLQMLQVARKMIHERNWASVSVSKKTAIHELVDAPGDQPEKITFLALMNNEHMINRFWSRQDFLLYQPLILFMRPGGNKWEKATPSEPRIVAKHSLVEWDGSTPLSDHISNLFGYFRHEDGSATIRLSAMPFLVRVLFTPQQRRGTPPDFRSVQRFTIRSRKWARTESGRPELQLNTSEYVLKAAVKTRSTPAGADFVRIYGAKGENILPPPDAEPIVENTWRIGQEGTFALFYIKTSDRRPVAQTRECAAETADATLFRMAARDKLSTSSNDCTSKSLESIHQIEPAQPPVGNPVVREPSSPEPTTDAVETADHPSLFAPSTCAFPAAYPGSQDSGAFSGLPVSVEDWDETQRAPGSASLGAVGLADRTFDSVPELSTTIAGMDSLFNINATSMSQNEIFEAEWERSRSASPELDSIAMIPKIKPSRAVGPEGRYETATPAETRGRQGPDISDSRNHRSPRPSRQPSPDHERRRIEDAERRAARAAQEAYAKVMRDAGVSEPRWRQSYHGRSPSPSRRRPPTREHMGPRSPAGFDRSRRPTGPVDYDERQLSYGGESYNDRRADAASRPSGGWNRGPGRQRLSNFDQPRRHDVYRPSSSSGYARSPDFNSRRQSRQDFSRHRSRSPHRRGHSPNDRSRSPP
ncbi:hypothetical protein JX266_010622 [Neoarthrinium moseri]|nr:hypothetical protein JX266_010622 [Neoarthrinium moseri]